MKFKQQIFTRIGLSPKRVCYYQQTGSGHLKLYCSLRMLLAENDSKFFTKGHILTNYSVPSFSFKKLVQCVLENKAMTKAENGREVSFEV